MYRQKSYGKWILAGEHTVLRGGKALVFPLMSRYIEWSYTEESSNQTELLFQFKGVHGAELEILILGLIEKAFDELKISKNKIKGKVEVFSNLPLGAGLGASAALCVSLSRWLHYLGFVAEKDLFSFSKKLEDLFHGESSGVDVAVSLLGVPIIFSREFGAEPLNETWQPQIGLTYSGHRGMTKDCVQKVKEFFSEQQDVAIVVDQEMNQAVDLCQRALTATSLSNQTQQELFLNLAEGVKKARSCFEKWDLVDPSLENEMNLLLRRGAVAVKPTGSGLGGYVLSLWASDIPKDILKSY